MKVNLEYIQNDKSSFIIGCDEVGYGCLAGPLVVAGVKAPKDWSLDGLNDSKKLSEKKREVMRAKLEQLIYKEEITLHMSEKTNVEIDKLGVALALKSAYIECFRGLYQENSLIISDGILKFDNLGVDDYHIVSLIKADQQIPAVMAASILAKTYRDNLMKSLHKQYPVYGWFENVGYAAKAHLEGLEKYGPCPLHRFSYAPMKNMNLDDDTRQLKFGF